MRRLIILLATSVPVFAQPTVTNVRVDYSLAPNGAAPHSYRRIRWDLSASASYHRVQYGKTTSYGYTTNLLSQTAQTDLGLPLSGLEPNTTYDFCAQSSFDDSTWSACSGAALGSFTTAALPAVHPAPPQLPDLWTVPGPPNTTGYLAVTFNSSCVEVSPVSGNTLTQALQAAVTLQPTQGTVITIPHGTVCGTPWIPNDTQILALSNDSSHVNTTTGVFTAITIPSGFPLANGQKVIFTGAAGCLPGSLTSGNDSNSYYNNGPAACPTQGPFTPGVFYYLVNVSGSTFQVSATPGGSPIIPSDTGQVGGFTCLLSWPPMNSNWIVIQTDVPDSQFCPPGVRCMDSIWGSKKVTFQAQGGSINNPATNPITGSPGNTGLFTHNIYFRGARFTSTSTATEAAMTVDPVADDRMFYVPSQSMNSYIILDRASFIVPPFPNRAKDVITDFGGLYNAVVNSDLEHWDMWHLTTSPTIVGAGTQGWSSSFTGATFTVIPGSSKLGAYNTCTSTANVTFTITGGTSTTQGAFYVDNNCTPTLVLPTGMTATCTGSMTDNASVSHACLVTNSASPAFDRDSNGGFDCFAFGMLSFSGGSCSASSPCMDYSDFGATAWDGGGSGTQGIQYHSGPGPFAFNNNYLEGAGLLLHMDDGSIVDPVGVSFLQNTFFWDQSHKAGSSTWDGYEYQNRNGPECKHCREVNFYGNIVTGMYSSISLAGPAILFHTTGNYGTSSPAGGIGPPVQPGYTVQDIDIRYNTCTMSSSCFEVGENQQVAMPFPAAARIRIANNIMQTNGYTQTDGNTGPADLGGASGNPIELDGAMEDLIVDHNTMFDMRGINPQIYHTQALFIEGCQFTNNFMWFNLLPFGVTTENQTVTPATPAISGTGSTLFNSQCTNDPGTPGGIWSNNVAVPYYASFGGYPNFTPNSSSLVSDSAICTTFGGTWGPPCTGGHFSQILTGASAPANLALVGMQNPAGINTFALLNSPGSLGAKLLYNAPCVSGGNCTTDGADAGADISALLTAQGAVGTPTVLQITSTSAEISWWAYDGTVACSVDYATAPNDPSTQTGGGRVTAASGNSQSVSLTGLTALTGYNYRVLCPVNQPTGRFFTQ